MSEPPGFRDFAQASAGALLRSGWLLTGDWGLAQDLVHEALAKTWSRWSALDAAARESYVRRTMLRLHLTSRRRRWRNGIPTDAPPDRAAVVDTDGEVDTRM
ncbi:MAG: hypothetical protein ACR2JQ_09745, partial [Mycobacteriales bacterium]